MDETVLKIGLAGLCHDIGKIAQESIKITDHYRRNNEDIYQPKDEGRPTHIHALYTAAFLEQVASILPPEMSAKRWGEGEVEDTVLNLAACHHNPRTAMQWIVSMADRISSGLDRVTFEKGESIAYKDYKMTRLLPILESLGRAKGDGYSKSDNFNFRYPLSPLSARTIFPQKIKEVDHKQAGREYQALFDLFIDRLAEVHHKNENINLWAEHFDSLLMIFTSMIPAARVGDVIHDVSLYDHSRTTAALAAALYHYHKATQTLGESAIKTGNSKKFLFISGDFYGIQDFIFSAGAEINKFRSKILRGRSFAVSLFGELAADLICRNLDLPFLSVLMSAAGKFHIIAPNIPETALVVKETETMINDWLFEITYGQSSLGISMTTATPNELHAGVFADFWDRHLKNIEERKIRKVDLNRYGGSMQNYLDSFINDTSLVQKPLCLLCGKRPSSISAENESVFSPDITSSCDLCRDHVFLGKNLVKKPMVAILTDKAGGLKQENCLLKPIFGKYQVSFANDYMKKSASDGHLLKLWQVKAGEDGSLLNLVTVKLINGHVPLYRECDNTDDCLIESAKSEEKILNFIDQIKSGTPKTFSHIAIKSRSRGKNNKCHGIEAIGVMKADVDNLGMLFGCGLPKNRFTISRLATLSRQLNNFFVLYLPYLLAMDNRFYDTYTVFAGGDDLFLIGPWNQMADLAEHLNHKFSEYVCNNEEVTFSAGISVHKPNIPVAKLAESAENALSEAKRAGRNRVTMFGETVTWKDFCDLLKTRKEMESWTEHNYISDSMFYRFNEFTDMADIESVIMNLEQIEISEMDSLKWRALFKYSLSRNINRKLDAWEKALAEIEVMAVWLDHYRGGMRIPLWHVLLEKRQ